MRLIPVEHLRGGEIIGKDILTSEGSILLKSSSHFKLAYKNRLLEHHIYEIYVDDEISRGIIPQEIISPPLKNHLKTQLNEHFKYIENVMSINAEDLQPLTNLIIEELSNKDIILDMTNLKYNDRYTYTHCVNVAIMSCALAQKMGFNYEDLKKIVTGALLHDIGKIMIPKDILNKSGPLTPDERMVIETHCQIGYDIIKNNPTLSPVSKVIILCHHEREDGKGYPLCKGEDLHIGTKIVAVADVFDALVSNRPYRDAFPVNLALSILKKEKLNLQVIETLESLVAFYPIGSTVKLNNHLIGLVEQNFAADLTKPIVRIIYNLQTRQPENYKCDLRQESSLKIVEKLVDLPY